MEKKDELIAVLKVKISKEEYAPAVEQELKKTQRKVVMPGFRPGKAPMSMVKKMYGRGIYVDEVNKLASTRLNAYLDENKINYLAQPLMGRTEDQKIDFDAEDDFIFAFEIGLAPEVSLNLSKADTLTRYVIKVGEAELDKEVETLRNRYGKTETVNESIASDVLYLNATELNENGEPLDGGIAEKNISTTAELISDEETRNKLIGVKAGDQFDADLFKLFNGNDTVMANTLGIPKEGVNDLNPQFRFVVSEIKRHTPAELDQSLFDEVFGEGNVQDLTEFRSRLKEDLEKYYAREAENMLEHELDHLITDKHDFQLPDSFLKRWLMENNPEEVNEDNVDEKYRNEARQLRVILLRNVVLEKAEVKISPEEVEDMGMAYAAQMLRQYGIPNPDFEFVKRIADNNKKEKGHYQRMYDSVSHRKFIELVKNEITIVEKEVGVEEFYAIIREHNHVHNH